MKCYAEWVERFIRFHHLRHPATMGAPEIEQFLTHLAADQCVSASTQNQAFFALLFLYEQVLGIELPRLDPLRARRPVRLPVVLSVEEVRRLLDKVEGNDGLYHLMLSLLYGSGLRRQECCQMRVHDLDLVRNQLTIRHGKGGKDRVVMLPRKLKPALERHLEYRQREHARDVAAGQADAPLPFALAKKFPRAAHDLGWQFVFAGRQRSRDPKTGNVGRFHVNPGLLARDRTKATLDCRVGCHILRHHVSPNGAAAYSQGRQALGASVDLLPPSPNGATVLGCRPVGAEGTSDGAVPGPAGPGYWLPPRWG